MNIYQFSLFKSFYFSLSDYKSKTNKMNIVYIVNKVSITSIPSRWIEFLKNNNREDDVFLFDLKQMFRCFIYKKSATIIHGHHVKSMSVFLIFNFMFKLKNIYTVHGSYLYLSRYNKFLFRFVMNNTDKIAFVNTVLYDQLPNKLKEKISDKYQIIFNGVESDYNYEKIDIFKKYNLDSHKQYIFHPARFVEEKNHLNVIEGFKLAYIENNDLILILAGEGKLRYQIESKIKELGIENQVKLIGLIKKDEVYNFYNSSELFIMPSVSEGLNVSFLEALSMN